MEDLEILIMTLYSNCKTQNEVFLIRKTICEKAFNIYNKRLDEIMEV